MVESGQNIDLVVSELSELWSVLKFINAHNFDCKYLFSFSILSSINIAVLTFPNILEQHIVFDHFIHSLN